MYLIVLAVAIAGLAFLYERIQPVDRKWSNKKTYNLPPGPSGIPVMGNLQSFWDSRAKNDMISYLLSLKKYGDLCTLHMGSQLWVVINSDDTANDIIGKKAAITSDRPHFPVSNGLVSNMKRVVIQKRGPWDIARKLSRQLLSGSWTSDIEQWQDYESIRLLNNYIKKPQGWSDNAFMFGTASLYGVMTGGPLPNKITDEQMKEYQIVPQQFLNSLYSSACDFFPILDNLPTALQWWRPKWAALGAFHHRVFQLWWDWYKESSEQNPGKSSWVRDVALNTGSKEGLTDEELMYVTNSIVTAGADNTRMSMDTFVTVAARYPEIFQKAREEIDAACGPNAERLPNLADMAQMTYVCAFVKEVLRWRPIVPIVPPHRLMEELEYKGYRFPVGTLFMVNTMAISADCEKPEDFQPERWMDGNEKALTKNFWGFGGGRRVCVGYKLEQPALFLAMSRLIYCFNIKADAPLLQPGLTQYTPPEKFPVTVTSRSGLHEDLICKEWSAMGGSS